MVALVRNPWAGVAGDTIGALAALAALATLLGYIAAGIFARVSILSSHMSSIWCFESASCERSNWFSAAAGRPGRHTGRLDQQRQQPFDKMKPIEAGRFTQTENLARSKRVTLRDKQERRA